MVQSIQPSLRPELSHTQNEGLCATVTRLLRNMTEYAPTILHSLTMLSQQHSLHGVAVCINYKRRRTLKRREMKYSSLFTPVKY